MNEQGAPLQLRCAGAYSGPVSVQSLQVTVAELKSAITLLMGLPDACAPGLKLLAGGRNMKEDSKTLAESGIHAGTRLLAVHSQAARGALAVQEERMHKLDRLKDAADAISKRGGGKYNRGAFEFELENQAGQAVAFDESDRRALTMALALHLKGQTTMRQGDPKAALQELLLSEEAFSMVSPQHLSGLDNLPLMLIDLVWCMFQLQDVSALQSASQRLALARHGLLRSYGADLSRLRTLHGGFQPELATFLRLELLQGVAAFHGARQQEAQSHFAAAQEKLQRLQVDDTSLATLLSMGFSTQESTRALRFCSGDESAASAFALDARQQAEERKQRDKERQKERRKQRKFGQTVSGKYVDLAALRQLTGMGYEQRLAAEALRQADNAVNAALDALTSADANSALQQSLASRERRRGKRKYEPDELQVAALTSMGFTREAVLRALEETTGDNNRALDTLQGYGNEAQQWYADAMAAGPGGSGAGSSGAGGSAAGAGSSGAGGSSSAAAAGAAGASGAGQASSGQAGAEESDEAIEEDEEEEKVADEEMERELAAAAANDDPLAAYDVDVSAEAAALAEYMTMLDSATGL